MEHSNLLITCTLQDDGMQSIAELKVTDAESLIFEGKFTPETLGGFDVMFWLGEYLSGSDIDELTFTASRKAKASMISFDSVKLDIETLTKVNEAEYNAFLNTPFVNMLSELFFVSCHEYGEAYYLDGKLVAYHEVYCIGNGVHYIAETAIPV